jgi:hypothetical protein
MKLPLTGGCVCGAVRYESSAEPIMMVRCHCRDCQRITGGPYVPAVIFPYDSFRLTQGVIERYATDSEGGGHNLRGFCPKCGSRLTGAEDQARGIIGVLASSLDDPSIFAPKLETYLADAQPWDVLDPKTPKYPKNISQL